VIPIKLSARTELSLEWTNLFSRLAKRRAHLGLSRLARYASDQGIEPEGVNDELIQNFIAAGFQVDLLLDDDRERERKSRALTDL
jgi:hypothetical protein